MKRIEEPAGVFPETSEQRAQRIAADGGWFEHSGAVYDADGRQVAASMAELAEGLEKCGVIVGSEAKWRKLPKLKDARGHQHVSESGNPMTDWPELARRVRSSLGDPLGP